MNVQPIDWVWWMNKEELIFLAEDGFNCQNVQCKTVLCQSFYPHVLCGYEYSLLWSPYKALILPGQRHQSIILNLHPLDTSDYIFNSVLICLETMCQLHSKCGPNPWKDMKTAALWPLSLQVRIKVWITGKVPRRIKWDIYFINKCKSTPATDTWPR